MLAEITAITSLTPLDWCLISIWAYGAICMAYFMTRRYFGAQPLDDVTVVMIIFWPFIPPTVLIILLIDVLIELAHDLRER